MGMLLARCFPFGSSAQLLFACHVFALMVRFVSMNIHCFIVPMVSRALYILYLGVSVFFFYRHNSNADG